MVQVVCTATPENAGAIAGLLPHLGYEAHQEQVVELLAKLLQSPGHAVYVAKASNQVVGLCLLALVSHIASAGYAEVLELVVHPEFQGQGFGGLLLREGEGWALRRGFSRVRLRSGVHRTEAHEFYERQGYEKSKASFAFERRLSVV